jgi:hypothetical protein
MRAFDNSRWGRMNQRQKAVLGMCENFTQWDRKWLAALAVTYAETEVRVLLIDGTVSP